MSGRTQNSDAVDVIFVRLPGTSSALCGPRSILCNSPIRSAQSVATVLAGRHRQNSIHNHLNDISMSSYAGTHNPSPSSSPRVSQWVRGSICLNLPVPQAMNYGVPMNRFAR
jgi:hypothetical protein